MKRRRFKMIALAALAAGLLVMPLAACSGEVSFTTARLSEVTMARSLDAETLQPIDKTNSFTIDDPEIYLSAKFANAPSETEITSEWIYVEGEAEDLNNYMFDSVSIEVAGSDYLYFGMPMPEQGWPRGEYKIILYIDAEEAETVPFTVE